MSEQPADNTGQKEFWSTNAGRKWVAHHGAMDALMAPVLDLVLQTAQLQPGETVLDIGCGAGTSTAAAAQKVTQDGSVTGLDISQPLLDRGMHQFGDNPGVVFLRADAQTHAFETAAYDALISRFGVMFFADTIAAFINMARALRPGGRMVFAAWGPAPNNPWFMLPAKVAADHLGKMPKTDRTLPGPFAFEDQSRVTQFLRNAGLTKIKAQSHTLSLTPDGGHRAAAALCCDIGPAERALRHFEGTPKDHRDIEDGIAAAFSAYETDRLRIPADINLFTAIKPD